MTRRANSECPICYSLDIFGDKWTLIVVRDMLVYNKRYYREFLASAEGIATNILADRLKRLVEDGLAIREGDPESRAQNAYIPTDKAKALAPVLNAMVEWGLAWGPDRLRLPRQEDVVAV
jgi:DNA-binding HxlR family transcriptional regulator